MCGDAGLRELARSLFPTSVQAACQEVHSHAQTRSSQRAAFSRARVHIQGGKEWLKMDMGFLEVTDLKDGVPLSGVPPGHIH